jgi:hypothetical protein
MPDSIGLMPDWVFCSKFAFSLVIGWLAATGIERAFLWFMSAMDREYLRLVDRLERWLNRVWR